MTKRKALFVDKDGTLIPDIPYNVNPELIRLQNGVQSFKELQDLGYLLVIISNQSGVAHGYFRESSLKGVESRINYLLSTLELHLDGFYYCPHHPKGKIVQYAIPCSCRKPETGMLLQAAHDLEIDLNTSWMIGDILNDVEAGNKAGCKTILIDNGNETEWVLNAARVPDFRAKDLKEASEFILAQEKKMNANEVGRS